MTIYSTIITFISLSVIPWILYFILVAMLAWYYREYIKGGAKWRVAIVKLFLIGFSVVMFLYASYIVYNIIGTLNLSIITMIVVVTGLFVYRIRTRGYNCKKEEERKINGVKYVLCYTDIINAWYNHKTGKIYVSKALAQRLTDEELKAIVYHEEGHAQNKWLSRVSALLFELWIFALAGIMIILVLLWKTPLSIQQFLNGISIIYWIASILTLCAMIPSWIAEHESDKRALEKAGLDSIINGLIKVHVYGTLEGAGLLGVVDECRTKDIVNFENIHKKASTFATLILILLAHSLMFPKWIGDYIQRPIYYTHPPLQLRITFLMHHARSD